MNTAEMKMLRRAHGKTRKDHIGNVIIWENTFLVEKRLSWFGHVQRRDGDNVAKSVLNTKIDRSRPRGRPQLRWMRRHEKKNLHPEWASDRESWFEMIQNVNPYPGNDGKVIHEYI